MGRMKTKVLPFSQKDPLLKSYTTTAELIGLHCRLQTSFEHFYIHTYRRIVLDNFPKNLALASWHMDTSSMTQCHCENTSRCSLCYKLAYKEANADCAEERPHYSLHSYHTEQLLRSGFTVVIRTHAL